MPMDRRTPEEKREAMDRVRTIRQNNVQAIVRDLHDSGTSNVWIESTQITDDGHFYQRVVVENGEVSHPQFDTIMEVAAIHDAKVGLHEFSMNGHRFSRLTLWPSSEEN